MMKKIIVFVFVLVGGCMRWDALTVTDVSPRPTNLRLHLHDGSTVIVRHAVVQADSIVGDPWGGGPAGSRISVALRQVDRIEVGETDENKTAFLVVGILLGIVGLGVWAVSAIHYTT